jgi:hypothetical protein
VKQIIEIDLPTATHDALLKFAEESGVPMKYIVAGVLTAWVRARLARPWPRPVETRETRIIQ